ncbi:hypothetical protein ACGFYE_38775 [Streptomyces zaomyceticus]
MDPRRTHRLTAPGHHPDGYGRTEYDTGPTDLADLLIPPGRPDKD